MKLVSHFIVLFVFVSLSSVCLAMEQEAREEREVDKEAFIIHHSPEKALAGARYSETMKHRGKRTEQWKKRQAQTGSGVKRIPKK